jgi:hypothetical protein
VVEHKADAVGTWQEQRLEAVVDKGNPIAYTGLAVGTPVVTGDLQQFGTVEHVLQIPEEDLFDGIVVSTPDGLRFVERDQIAEITDTCVVCELSIEQAKELPPPSGSPVLHVDALDDTGGSLHDRVGRLFRRPRWLTDFPDN